MPYEPNAYGIETPNTAAQTSGAFSSGIDQGVRLQQQIAHTQLIQQQVQQQHQEMEQKMADHAMDGIRNLTMQDASSPIYKYQLQQTVKNLGTLGIQVDPDALKAATSDETQKQKIYAALSNLSSLDPQLRGQAQKDIVPLLKNPEQLISLGEKSSEIASKYQSQNVKMDQFYDKQKQFITSKASEIVKKWDQQSEFAQMTSNVLDQYGNFKTGIPDAMIKEAATKVFSNGVPRQFTINMMNQSAGLLGRFENALSGLETGKKLTAAQRSDLQKGIQSSFKSMQEAKYNELTPWYNQFESLRTRAGGAGKQIDPGEFADPGTWDAVRQRVQGSPFNPQTNSFDTHKEEPAKKKRRSAKALSPYEMGSNQTKDNAIKLLIQGGKDLDFINKVLQPSGRALSEEDFDSLKGGQ